MGGILLRQLVADRHIVNPSRVVMLAPPNAGSELVDRFGEVRLFRWFNGPAGGELGTSASATPLRLGPAAFELGVIAGTRSINPVLSALIPGEDDGKVAVTRARLNGMSDFVKLPCTHTLMMHDRSVQDQTLRFLGTGRFAPAV